MSEAREKLVGEMNETEFNALIEEFIEWETEGTGEVPAEVLFEALPDFLTVYILITLYFYVGSFHERGGC